MQALLLDELAALGGSLAIVLDDDQAIRSATLLEALEFLLEHLPSQSIW